MNEIRHEKVEVPDIQLLGELGWGMASVRPSHEIAESLGVNQRAIGFIVGRLRKAGCPIGSVHGSGYYLIQTDEELEDTISHIEARKRGIDATINALREAYAENRSGV